MGPDAAVKGPRVLKLIRSKSPEPPVLPRELGTASGRPLSSRRDQGGEEVEAGGQPRLRP